MRLCMGEGLQTDMGQTGYFHRSAATLGLLLYFASYIYCVSGKLSVPPDLTVQEVMDAKCPNETEYKCLPFGTCYSFDEYCDEQVGFVRSCFPDPEDEEKKLAWCLQLKKGQVQHLHRTCRFACEYAFNASELTVASEDIGGIATITADGTSHCQCEACRSACDYLERQQSSCECSTGAPTSVMENTTESTSGETNWDPLYPGIIGVLAIVLIICVSWIIKLKVKVSCCPCYKCILQSTAEEDQIPDSRDKSNIEQSDDFDVNSPMDLGLSIRESRQLSSADRST